MPNTTNDSNVLAAAGTTKMKVDASNIERALVLLRAGLHLGHSSDENGISFNHATALWDGAECDGMCWLEEVSELLEDCGIDPEVTE